MTHKSRPIRGTTPQVEQAARQLRQNLTPAEAVLWQALRERQVSGLKFRCQHPVGQFILDFYCPSLKLVIEVDGDSHAQKAGYDQARSGQLQDHGYRILRFSNAQVLHDLQAVISCIQAVAKTEFPRVLGG